MNRTVSRIAACLMLIAAAAGSFGDEGATAVASKWESRVAPTPRGVRSAIQLGNKALRKKGARVLRNGKPALEVWFPKRMAKPNALNDGRLLALLCRPGRAKPGSIVTVRTLERGYQVGFSSIGLERADRELLLEQFPVKKWPQLGPTAPLALIRPEEPVWDAPDFAKARAAVYEYQGELQVLLALLPQEKRGVRWTLPARVRRLLGL